MQMHKDLGMHSAQKRDQPEKIFDPKPPANLEAITGNSQKQMPQAAQVMTN